MSRKHFTLLRSASTLESSLESSHNLHYSYSLSPSLTSAEISFHEEEFGMTTFDHHSSIDLTDTMVDHSNSEEGHDDMSNLDDQFMAMDINTPLSDWPQDPYQAYHPHETMATDAFFVDTSGTTVAYADPAVSPPSDYSYFQGYDYYNDYDYYKGQFDSIHSLDTTMTPAENSDAASSSSSGTHPLP